MTKGNSQLNFLMSAAALIGSVGAPFLYIGGIKTDVAVAQNTQSNQERRINTLEGNYDYLRRVIEAIATKNGVDVNKIRQDVISASLNPSSNQ